MKYRFQKFSLEDLEREIAAILKSENGKFIQREYFITDKDIHNLQNYSLI